MPSQRPTVLSNPRTDTAFVANVEQLLDSVATPEALQVGLRETYPAAVVRARDISSESGTVWYVYREGRWVPPPSDREGVDERTRG